MCVNEKHLILTFHLTNMLFEIFSQKKKRKKKNVSTDRWVIIDVLYGNHDSRCRLFLWQQSLVRDDHRQIVDPRHFIVQALPQVKARQVSDEELIGPCSS